MVSNASDLSKSISILSWSHHSSRFIACFKSCLVSRPRPYPTAPQGAICGRQRPLGRHAYPYAGGLFSSSPRCHQTRGHALPDAQHYSRVSLCESPYSLVLGSRHTQVGSLPRSPLSLCAFLHQRFSFPPSSTPSASTISLQPCCPHRGPHKPECAHSAAAIRNQIGSTRPCTRSSRARHGCQWPLAERLCTRHCRRETLVCDGRRLGSADWMDSLHFVRSISTA